MMVPSESGFGSEMLIALGMGVSTCTSLGAVSLVYTELRIVFWLSKDTL